MGAPCENWADWRSPTARPRERISSSAGPRPSSTISPSPRSLPPVSMKIRGAWHDVINDCSSPSWRRGWHGLSSASSTGCRIADGAAAYRTRPPHIGRRARSPGPGAPSLIVGGRGGRLLAAVVGASIWRPWATVLLSVLLAVGAGLYAFSTLDFLTSPLRLLPQRARYVVLLNQYLQDFSELDDIIVAVQAPSPGDAKRYADRLVRGLRSDGFQARITYRVDPSFFERRGLLYLAVDDLTRLRDRLFDYDEFIRSYADRPTLVRLLEGLNQQFASAMALSFLDLGIGGDGQADLRFLDAVVDEIAAHLDGNGRYVSPWGAGFSLGRLDDPDAGYYFSADERLLFLFVVEQQDEGNFASNRGRIETLRRAIGKLASEFPDVRAGVTGGPTIADDEMATAVRDSAIATALAGVLTLTVLLVAYRRLGTALLLLGTLTASLLWSLGIITLFVGHLSVFSIMFLSLVIGVGIDYGIYFLYRFQEEWALDTPVAEALSRTADRTGPGMLLGALTAAGTFFV